MTTPTLTDEQELAILFPEPVEVKVGRITIAVTPMNVGQCLRFAVKARPILRAAMLALPEDKRPEDLANPGALPESVIVNLIAGLATSAMEYPDELFAAMAIATGRPVEFIEKLPPKSALELARRVFEVNADFFGRGVDPVELGARTIPPSVAPGVGPTH